MFWLSDFKFDWTHIMSWTIGERDSIIILLTMCVVYCLMMMYIMLEKGNKKMERLMEKNIELEEEVFDIIAENTKLKNILINNHI